MGAAAEEDAEAEVVGKRFVGGGTEVGVEFCAKDVTLGESVAPLSTDVRGKDTGEVATCLRGECGEERRAVERTEVMRPDGSGEKSHLIEEVATEGKPSAQAFVEGP